MSNPHKADTIDAVRDPADGAHRLPCPEGVITARGFEDLPRLIGPDFETVERGWPTPDMFHLVNYGAGGPASIRARCRATASSPIDQSDSTHQVAPASTHSRSCSSAVAGSLTPSATTS